MHVSDEKAVLEAPSAETQETHNRDGEEVLTTGQLFLELLRVIVLAMVIIIPVRTFLFQPFFVSGSSMEPNFEDGQYLVIGEFGYKTTDALMGIPIGFTIHPFKELHREDVTVFEFSKNPETYYIKRVIALPGESIEIKHGRVVIYNALQPQGFVLDESGYLSRSALLSLQDMPRVTLKEDEYFLMGDNRQHSHDSRSFGPVKEEKIIGRVLLRAWPVTMAKLF
jgi:signal peptidase I